MSHKHRIIIEPGSHAGNYWKDLWSYRGLFYFLAWRDILVRYKQTAIGITWSVLRPIFYISAFALFKMAVGDAEPDFVLNIAAAIVPWQFFSTSFSEISNSLVVNSNLLSKVYFPRLLVPASSLVVCLIDFLISFFLVTLIMLWQQHLPGWPMLMLPVFLLLAILTSFGTGLFIASLNVKYRDFRFIIPFIVQIGLFISPIAFNSADKIYANPKLPEFVKYLYSLNPMVSVIDGFKWCIIGQSASINLTSFVISLSSALFFLMLGLWYFRKTERSFADII